MEREKIKRTEKTGRAEKIDITEKMEKTKKKEKTGKRERVEKIARTEKPDTAGKKGRSRRAEYQITAWCHRMIRQHVEEGAFCVDATMGRGNDTEFLCGLAGPRGRVVAFDIQEEAVRSTRQRLEAAVPQCNYSLIHDSHENMRKYVEPGTADCIVFNLGYLPGADHSVSTRPETTIEALNQSLDLLAPGGLLSVCVYSGGDTGFEEKDRVMAWLKGLDSGKFLVMVTEYYNRPNHPPIPAFVVRL